MLMLTLITSYGYLRGWNQLLLDLWSKYLERSHFTDWTCKPCLSTDGGSIIDHIVTSSTGILDSEILVANGHNDFVLMTNHRAIVGCLILKPPNRNSNHCMHDIPTPVLNNPRIRFPCFKDKHLFQTYHNKTDSKIMLAGLHVLFNVQSSLLRAYQYYQQYSH